MADFQRKMMRNTGLLGSMLVLAAVYIGWLSYFGQISASGRLDGTLGILLGLFISSHPAANILDMLLFMRPEVRESLLTSASGRVWLLFNLLCFLAAWAVIFSGTLRFVAHVPSS